MEGSSKFNYEGVVLKLREFNTQCDLFDTTMKEMDSAVTSAVGVSTGGLYGYLGSSMLKEWDNNCSVFLNFRGLFNEWNDTISVIHDKYAEFEKKATEKTDEAYTNMETPPLDNENAATIDPNAQDGSGVRVCAKCGNPLDNTGICLTCSGSQATEVPLEDAAVVAGQVDGVAGFEPVAYGQTEASATTDTTITPEVPVEPVVVKPSQITEEDLPIRKSEA